MPTRESFSESHMKLLNDFAIANGHSLEELDKLGDITAGNYRYEYTCMRKPGRRKRY